MSKVLFELVHSLTGIEKTYFKKYSAFHVKGEVNIYVRIFNAVERQKKYDGKGLIQQFRGEVFAKQFPVAKNYLYNHILESLESYNRSNIQSKVSGMIRQTEILLEKGLTAQAEKMTERVRALAEQNELFPQLMELFPLSVEIKRLSAYTDPAGESYNQEFGQTMRILEKQKDLLVSQNVNAQIYHRILTGGFIRNYEELAPYHNLVKEEPLRKKENCRSERSLLLYYHSRFGYYSRCEHWNKALHCITELINLMESKASLIRNNNRLYINSLRNLVSCHFNLGSNEMVLPILEKLMNFESRSPRIKREIFFFVRIQGLTYYYNTNRVDAGMKLAGIVEKEMEHLRYDSFYPQYATALNYTLAITHIKNRTFKEASAYINNILNAPAVDHRSDLQAIARVLYIIIHFELGNTDLMESAARSCYRYLKKRKRLYRFEEVVLDFIRRKMPLIQTNKELVPALTALADELDYIGKLPFEKNILKYFDFGAWLQKKCGMKVPASFLP